MISISLCMIVKDEEDSLAKCLASVAGAVEEIIIVDTGSRDNTQKIAARFNAKIFSFKWCDDFAAARNFSFAQASGDYIMWLDADDIILPADLVKLQALKESLAPEISAVMMRYNTGFDAAGRVTFSFFRERLVKRSSQPRWREPVHEYLEICGQRVNADICVTHAKPPGRAAGRNIHIYEQRLAAGQQLSPRGMYYFARELKDHQRLGEAAQWFGQFLACGRGWVEDNIAACGELAKCYLALQQPEQALAALLQSFRYDNPRAEICCQLGYFFKEQQAYRQAVFWFGLVLKLERAADSWGFCSEDCWGYLPCLELALCYHQLGDNARAAAYNEQAAIFKPEAPAVLHNRAYFENLLATAGS